MEQCDRSTKRRFHSWSYIVPIRCVTMLSHSSPSGSRQTGFARPAVPIRCVALVAFLTMQVGMNPRTFDAFVPLRGFVRSRPIALRIPPESGEGERESRWRLGRGEGLPEFVEGHVSILMNTVIRVPVLAFLFFKPRGRR